MGARYLGGGSGTAERSQEARDEVLRRGRSSSWAICDATTTERGSTSTRSVTSEPSGSRSSSSSRTRGPSCGRSARTSSPTPPVGRIAVPHPPRRALLQGQESLQDPRGGALPARGQGRPRTRLPHLEPGECFVAGGMWMPEPEVLQQIRQRIADKPSEWAKAHGKLDHSEETLKRPPRGSTRTIR